MAHGRAGSSPAFGTIKFYFINIYGELAIHADSPFFVCSKFGAKSLLFMVRLGLLVGKQ